MGNRKLKPWVIPAMVVIVIAILGAAVFGVSRLIGKDDNPSASTNPSQTQQQENVNKPTDSKNDDNSETEGTDPVETQETIKGYVNTFSGYTSLFAANGGNVTQDGSNFDKAGLNVEIYIEDDDDNIIKAFENGEIQFFAMTVNKMALVSKQLEDKGIQTVMPYFIDTSTGGDGIVTDNTVKNITDLKNVKIGMAKNSVSTAIPVWFLNESGLSEEEVQKIVDNFVLFDSTQEAVDAFVRGDVGAVSTWNMTGALEKENSHLLFSTASAEYLVIDGIVFNKEFAESHKDEVTAIIDALITTVNDINNDVNIQGYYDAIRSAVPDFSEYSNEDMAAEISYAKFLGFNGNLEALDVAEDIYKDFCKVWKQLGFETNEEYNLISDSYIVSLGSKWDGKENANDSSITNDAEDYVDQEALITQYAKVLFNGDSATFKTGYEQTNKELLDQFIKVAKVLNKTVIKISGHVNLGEGSSVWDEATQSYKIAPGFKSSEFAYKLSLMRAETVKEYMVSQGIDEDRIIIEGLGGDYPIDTNDTEEGRSNNRSCEISFYQAGY
ncbi:MAG: OmpA family protein [Clostridia bacterium]|nr:OmpA family protein [Lachnospiraceae bacterium]MBQ7410486.1 OmpA family protein [Clostridia bacterium]